MRRVRARTGGVRGVGMIVAISLAASFVMLLGWFWVFGRGRPAPTPSPRVVADDSRPPDIRQLPPSNMGAITGVFATGAGFQADIADRKDPTRRAWRITADTSEVLEGRNFALTNPVAYGFLDDGRVLRLRAKQGRMYWPGQEAGARPETGSLSGDAYFEMFEPAPGRAIDFAKDPPTLVGRTETMQFDGTLGVARIPGEVTITTDEIDYRGRQAYAQFDESSQRLNVLFVERTNRLVIKQARRPGEGGATPTPAPAPAADAGPATTRPATTRPADPSVALAGDAGVPPRDAIASPTTSAGTQPVAADDGAGTPIEQFYHVQLRDQVVATQGSRRLTGDLLEVWARVVDNKLTDGAVASRATPTRPEARGASAALAVAAGAAVVGAAQSSTPSEGAVDGDRPAPSTPPVDGSSRARPRGLDTTASDEPVVIEAAGPLEVRPVGERPEELAADEVAMRVSTTTGTSVAFSDQDSGARAEGETIAYGLTSRRLALSSRRADGALVTMQGSGRAVGRRFDVDLASGRIWSDAPGRVFAAGEAPVGEPLATRELRWDGRAEFDLAVEGGRVTQRLAAARLSGGVWAEDAGGRMGAERVSAWFDPDADDPQRPLIARLLLVGGAQAADSRGAALWADTIDATFVPAGAGRAQPSRLVASGRVEACRGGTLRADSLDAALAHNEQGQLVVERAEAIGAVAYEGEDGIGASADSLVAEPSRESVDLIGAPVVLSQGPSRIVGSQMRLEGGSAQRLTVFGAGDLRFEERGGGVLAARWNRQLTFNDSLGEAECAGAVEATYATGEAGARDVDAVRGERLTIAFTPREAGDGSRGAGLADVIASRPDGVAAGDGAPAPRDGRARRLLRAEVIGGVEEPGGSGLASAESGRAAPGAEGDVPTVLAYLESARIVLTNPDAGSSLAGGTLSTPGPGRLLVHDHRAPAQASKPAPGEASGLPVGTSTRGDTLFAWSGSLAMTRATGEARFIDRVSMVHRPLEGDDVQLKCEQLVATLRERDQAPAPAPGAPRSGVRLVGVDASGNPELRAGRRELLGGTLRYSADAQEILARGVDAGTLTAIDHAAGVTSTAREVRWLLGENRWELRDFSSTAPN